ncbi:protein FLC EXPRESSOR [Corylus avellana]|uniref:protein FLC EXPRESSOR n=1 Tax=Corylus avellana TaxID=13451 RepID=UPI00286A9479|nr:protein FLC EXPRESSOR [Corylus avellana]
MAGRSHASRIDDSRLREVHHFSLSSRHHNSRSIVLEDRIAIQHREIQSLLEENQRLASAHVALKHELAAAQRELRLVSAKAADVKAESDAHVRDLYERSLVMEAEVRAIDAMSAELAQVRSDVQKLGPAPQELAAQFRAIEDDIARARSEVQQVPAIKSEIERTHKEIQRGRAAIEYEKKTRAHNLEQRQLMERHKTSMAGEIERLRAELANAEKRARAAAAAANVANPSTGYAVGYGNPVVAYSYPDPYGTDQVQVAADAGPQYGSGAMPHGTYDMQGTHVYR